MNILVEMVETLDAVIMSADAATVRLVSVGRRRGLGRVEAVQQTVTVVVCRRRRRRRRRRSISLGRLGIFHNVSDAGRTD